MLQFQWPISYEATAALSGDIDRWILIGLALIALSALWLVARPPRRFRADRRELRRKQSVVRLNTAAPVPARAEAEFDSSAQMRAIAPFQFETQPLLNQGESRLLYLLEQVAGEVGGGFRVMAQTSLGEIIRPRAGREPSSDVAQAYRAINSKRLDLAIFNRFGKLVVGVEYQGHGHYRETAFMRDAIKREVLRRAGVPMLEVPAEYQAAKIGAQVHELLAVMRTAEDAKPGRAAAERRPAA